jgi:hypothetical protein
MPNTLAPLVADTVVKVPLQMYDPRIRPVRHGN